MPLPEWNGSSETGLLSLPPSIIVDPMNVRVPVFSFLSNKEMLGRRSEVTKTFLPSEEISTPLAPDNPDIFLFKVWSECISIHSKPGRLLSNPSNLSLPAKASR